MTTHRRHVVVLAAAAAALLVTVAGPASAHVEPSPAKVKVGQKATVAFSVEHGCSGSPTTGMKFQVPATVKVFAPVAKAGWKTSVAGQVVTFSGGQIPKAGTFKLSFTAPTTPGPLDFKVIQTCVKGATDWIEVQQAGQAEPEHPAPRVTVTA